VNRFHFTCLSAFLLLAAIAEGVGQSQETPPPGKRAIAWAIAVHGGAGSAERLSDEERQARETVLGEALDLGSRLLAEGGSSLDAVERVIRRLEDSPHFNAGRGAVLNAAGGFELDASIMDGSTLACGAVAGVRTVKNPISVARRVMTETSHVLLGGEGAEQFAVGQGFKPVEPKYFFTQQRHREWQQAQAKAAASRREGGATGGGATNDNGATNDGGSKGTVGCVALDTHGNLAAGTSTGGRTGKLFGRIGDSPVVGAGTYADNRTCGVSGTGIGEEYIRHAVAYDISARMRYLHASLEESVRAVMHETLRKGDGGVIAVSHDGAIVMDFNTPGMARAAADSTGRREVALGAKR
jgi:beta-aspartyl-peptidase (threonine type)